MNDYLVRAMTTNKEIRALVVRSTNVVNHAQQSHQTSPVATAALGRTLTAALLMGAMVKSGDEIAIRIEGDGPLKKIIAQANQYGEVRGYVYEPLIDLYTNDRGKLDVSRAVGNGNLFVTKRIGLKEPYEGSVPLISGEIAEDLTYYFTKSEQIPSSVGLGVLVDTDLSVKAAGGFIIQLLPNPSEETISLLEKNLKEIKSVSSLIEAGKSPEEILKIILHGFDYRIMETRDVYFKCKCNYDRITDLLYSLDEQDLKETLAQEGSVEIKCQFCGQVYKYSKEDIRQIIETE